MPHKIFLTPTPSSPLFLIFLLSTFETPSKDDLITLSRPVHGDLEILNEQESSCSGYTFYRPLSPDELVRKKKQNSLSNLACIRIA